MERRAWRNSSRLFRVVVVERTTDYVGGAKKAIAKKGRKNSFWYRMNDNKSLAHTSWNRKYHIVFAPKYRRKIFYGEMRAEIGKILRELCGWKGVTIIEAEVGPNHIHMQIEIPPKMSVSSFKGFLKGKKQSDHT